MRLINKMHPIFLAKNIETIIYRFCDSLIKSMSKILEAMHRKMKRHLTNFSFVNFNKFDSQSNPELIKKCMHVTSKHIFESRKFNMYVGDHAASKSS